jgi:hypothetical protein
MFRSIRPALLVAFTAMIVLVGAPLARAAFVPVPLDAIDVITPSTTLNASATITSPPDVENSHAIDGYLRGTPNPPFNGLIFSGAPEILSLSGFTPGPIGLIRVWTIAADPGRVPTSVTIRSSISLVSTLTATDYETVLGTFTPLFTGPPPAGTDENYADFVVTAPAGTQSLFFDFDSPSGARLSEVQAFVPEPASIGLAALAAGLLVRRRAR